MRRCTRNESVLFTSRMNLCAITRVYHLKKMCSHRSSEWTWIRCEVVKTHWVCSQHDMVCPFAMRMWTGYKMVDKCTICYVVQWTKCAPIRCVRAWVQFWHVLSNQTNICIKHVSPRKTYKLCVFCVKAVYLIRILMLFRLSMAMIQALFAPKTNFIALTSISGLFPFTQLRNFGASWFDSFALCIQTTPHIDIDERPKRIK